jgi:hypothetical protein
MGFAFLAPATRHAASLHFQGDFHYCSVFCLISVFYLLASEMAALPVIGQGSHPTSSFLAAKIGKILVPCNTKYYKNACVYTFLTTPMHARSNAHGLTDLSSSAPKAMLQCAKSYAPQRKELCSSASKLCFEKPKAMLQCIKSYAFGRQKHCF